MDSCTISEVMREIYNYRKCKIKFSYLYSGVSLVLIILPHLPIWMSLLNLFIFIEVSLHLPVCLPLSVCLSASPDLYRRVQVLHKFPVVQHVLFGSLLSIAPAATRKHLPPSGGASMMAPAPAAARWDEVISC